MPPYFKNSFSYDETWLKQLKDKSQAIDEINYILHEAGFEQNFKMLISNSQERIVDLNPVMPENPYLTFSKNGGYLKPVVGKSLRSAEGLGHWAERLDHKSAIEVVAFVYSHPQVEARLPAGVTPHFFDKTWFKWWWRNRSVGAFPKHEEPEPELDPSIAEAVFATTRYTEAGEHKQSRRIASSVRQKVWLRDEGRCAKCESRDRLHFDHIIPFSRGGANTEDNLELLCEKCNLSKSDRIA